MSWPHWAHVPQYEVTDDSDRDEVTDDPPESV